MNGDDEIDVEVGETTITTPDSINNTDVLTK